MRSIESEGETIDQAIEQALRALEVGRDQVQIDILTDASRGVLGFGGKKARVRATVRPPLASGFPGQRDGLAFDSRETSPTGRAAVNAETPTPTEAAGPQGFQTRCRGILDGILSRL